MSHELSKAMKHRRAIIIAGEWRVMAGYDVRAWRLRWQISQAELAKALHVSLRTLVRIERAEIVAPLVIAALDHLGFFSYE